MAVVFCLHKLLSLGTQMTEKSWSLSGYQNHCGSDHFDVFETRKCHFLSFQILLATVGQHVAGEVSIDQELQDFII